MGMSAGDVSKCVVRWNPSTSDKHIDLPMSKRKLNNFHLKCRIESGSASNKAHVDENSAGPSSVVDVIEYCSSSSDDEDENEDEESMGVDVSSNNVLDELDSIMAESGNACCHIEKKNVHVKWPCILVSNHLFHPYRCTLNRNLSNALNLCFQIILFVPFCSGLMHLTLATYKAIKPSEVWAFQCCYSHFNVSCSINDY